MVKDGILVVFTDGNGYGGAVLTADNTMQRQRDGRPLILADTAIIVGAEVSQAILFKQRHRAQVQAWGINMGNVQGKPSAMLRSPMVAASTHLLRLIR